MKKTLCKMKKTLRKAALTLVAVIVMILLLVVVCKAAPAFAEEIISIAICAGAVGIIPLSAKLLLMLKHDELPDNDTLGGFVCAIALFSPVIAAVIINISQNIASAIIAVFR